MSDVTDEAPTRRLVVELNSTNARALADLCDREQLNKTTIVNRAVQVYKLIMDAQLDHQDVVIGGEHVRIV